MTVLPRRRTWVRGGAVTVMTGLSLLFAAPSPAVVVPAVVPYTPYFEGSPRGEAPCPEGDSRVRTLYAQGYEATLPEARFNQGFTRVAGTAPEGSVFARASIASGANASKHMFLPYVQGTKGTQTRLAFAYRNSATPARSAVYLNSFGVSLPTTTTWQGRNYDVTGTTADEGGWLGAWFQHNATTGASTYLDIDNVQLFTCRNNATTRISGTDRYETAAQLSQVLAPGVPVAFVARGDLFPDALSASALAGHLKGPVLLTEPESLPVSTLAALERLRPQQILILGGPTAVGPQVEETLTSLAPVVRRLGGTDRYETSALVSAEFPSGTPIALLAVGTNFADAMTGAALGGARGGPMLLTETEALPPTVEAELVRLRPQRIFVLGSADVVGDAVAAAAAGYAVGPEPKVVRLAGPDRYATSVAIAAQFGTSVTHTYLATGENFPDGLAAAALAGAQGVPLLITGTGLLPSVVRERLVQTQDQRGYVIGGDDVVSQLVRDQFGQTLP